ncbi:PaaX family transcriptional regulator C-terminal domain-containing protein [Streptomyces sp. NPDC048290]|uniref:PaaX family transcriptional regulator n=1 Tax=Streptomyces sp. NPDC048290 TaxID=3155811 RepID=UPI0034212284
MLSARSEMLASAGHRPGRRLLNASGARSMLLTVLGEYALPWGQPIWARTMITALERLGFDETSARQAITRTRADGWIITTPVGRRVLLALTPGGAELLREGNDRLAEFARQADRWDGNITLLSLDTGGMAPARREEVRNRLRWSGFGQLSPSLHLSFDRRAEGQAVIALDELGLRDRAASFQSRLGAIGDPRALVEQAWDLDEIAAARRSFVAEAECAARDDDPFAARTRIVHAWRHLPLRDPGLPRDYEPAEWTGEPPAAVYARLAARVERDANRCWARMIEDTDPES